MAINTGGFQLSALPQTNINFRIRGMDNSGLGRGISQGLMALGEQKRARQAEAKEEAKIEEEKARLNSIGDAVTAAIGGDTEAMQNLDGRSRLEAMDTLNEWKREEELASLRSLDKSIKEQGLETTKLNFQKAERQQQVDTLAPMITFDEEGDLLPNEATALVDDPSILAEAVQKARLTNLKTMEEELTLDKLRGQLQEKDVVEAFAAIQAGEKKLEDFSDKPYYAALVVRDKYQDPEERYEVYKSGDFTILVDKLDNRTVSVDKDTELEALMKTAGFSDDESASFARKVLGGKAKSQMEDYTIGDTDIKVTPVERTLLDDFNLAMKGEKRAWFNPKRYLAGKIDAASDAEKEAAQKTFLQQLRRAIPQLKEDPSDEAKAEFDEAFGPGAADAILGGS